MKIAVLGTGMVGEAIASRLMGLGHEVTMGSRTGNNPRALAWAARTGGGARTATFGEAAAPSELVFNCTKGSSSLEALRAVGAERLEGKILVDVANDMSAAGKGPLSLAEEIQEAFPGARVVKTLNTINCGVMVDPSRLSGAHAVFMSGNDREAKGRVGELLRSFGWREVIDLGDIATARATEAYLRLWLSLSRALGTVQFNIALVR
jgi:8-hydroxy-5-deazaflavin:NADPH oxidoreductase